MVAGRDNEWTMWRKHWKSKSLKKLKRSIHGISKR